MSLKEQVLELRLQGMSYGNIAKQLGCAKSTTKYHCGGEDQKNQHRLRMRKRRKKQHPYAIKIEHFIYNHKNKDELKPNYNLSSIHLIRDKIKTFHREHKMSTYVKPTFSVDDVIQKFGDNPICYLTGESIDIHKPRTYQFDHIIPRSRGGDNSLENLGICTTQANRAKSNMTHDEFIYLCKKIIQYHEYKNAP